MQQSINLIPQQERQEQQKTALVKASTVFSILLLIVVAGVSAYFFFETDKQRGILNKVNSDIDQYRSEIKARSQVEIDARNLDKKLTVLTELFNSRLKYSVLLKEFNALKPLGVDVTSFDVRADTINISGQAVTHISVANFINSLLGETDEFYSLGTDSLSRIKGLFTSVKLNSVNFDSGTNEVKYSLSITFDQTKLKDL